MNLAESIVLEFYSKRPGIDIYPLRSDVTPDDVTRLLLDNGYDVSFPKKEGYPNIFRANYLFQDGSEISPDRIPDKIFLVSRMERLRGLVRYRQHKNGPSIKIECDDTEIGRCLSPLVV